MSLPEPGPLTAADIRATVEAIAAVQLESGCIPHFEEAIADPWNHIEAAMALDVGGLHAEAERAYRWLARIQRPDGAWASGYLGDEITDPTLDSNFCSYIASGLWHHVLATGSDQLAQELWPTLNKAIEFVLELQSVDGSILWARDDRYRPWPRPLLTGSACIYLSLGCAIAIAERLGEERPDWELARVSLGEAVMNERVFQPKDRFSMDWYYPVLAGVIRGDAARDRLAQGWEDFVIDGCGARCVGDRPWATAGETAELVLACIVAGMDEEAHALMDWSRRLRSETGGYWMGATWPDGTIWPQQQPTWGSGALVLAADTLAGESETSRLFRGLTEAARLEIGQRIADPL